MDLKQHHSNISQGFSDVPKLEVISLCFIEDSRWKNFQIKELQVILSWAENGNHRTICIFYLLSTLSLLFLFITHIRYKVLSLNLSAKFALLKFRLEGLKVFVFHFLFFSDFSFQQYKCSNAGGKLREQRILCNCGIAYMKNFWSIF